MAASAHANAAANAAKASETRWRTLMLARKATRMEAEKEELDFEADIALREAQLAALCKALDQAFRDIPLLAAQVPTN